MVRWLDEMLVWGSGSVNLMLLFSEPKLFMKCFMNVSMLCFQLYWISLHFIDLYCSALLYIGLFCISLQCIPLKVTHLYILLYSLRTLKLSWRQRHLFLTEGYFNKYTIYSIILESTITSNVVTDLWFSNSSVA